MLGQAGKYAADCFQGNFIGANFDIEEDIASSLKDSWANSRDKLVSLYLQYMPEKSRVSAGLACGFLWTICKGLSVGDIVLCPNGKGEYLVGEIASDYYYSPNDILPHRRKVQWHNYTIKRTSMSEDLRHSTGSIGTCSDITRYGDEIDTLILNNQSGVQTAQPAPSVKTVKFDERSLHPLFCSYLRNEKDIFAKTIYHEKSTSKDKEQKWVHPDIIGVHFADFKTDDTNILLKSLESKQSLTIYSFEMKKEIRSDYDLKEYYFQALSNSSWANRGYLVAFDINEQLFEEMERLNEAFGIGIIRLQAHNTEILFEAKEKELDYTTIDKLCNINPDFNSFIHEITSVLNAPKGYEDGAKKSLIAECDKILSTDDEIDQYCQDHNIAY